MQCRLSEDIDLVHLFMNYRGAWLRIIWTEKQHKIQSRLLFTCICMLLLCETDYFRLSIALICLSDNILDCWPKCKIYSTFSFKIQLTGLYSINIINRNNYVLSNKRKNSGKNQWNQNVPCSTKHFSALTPPQDSNLSQS